MACGCSGALDMCITALGNNGENILIPRPGFGLYSCLSVPPEVEARQYNLLVSNRSTYIILATVFNPTCTSTQYKILWTLDTMFHY